MYANFKSLSDKERKRQELIRQIEEDLRIEKLKEKAYSQAVWSSDVEANKINLNKSRTQLGTTSAETQTDQDIGDPSDSLSDIDDSNEVDVDAEITQLKTIETQENSQKEARNYLINLFKNNPEYVRLGIRLINVGTGRLHDFAVLGKNGEIRHVKTNRKMDVDPDTIDWVLSESYISDILKLTERNDNKRRKNIMNKAFGVLRSNANYEKTTRKTLKQMDESEQEAKKRREISDLEDEALQYILNLFALNPEEMKRLYDYLHPVSLTEIMTDYYLQPGENKVKIVLNGSQNDNLSVHKDVSWVKTLEYILERAKGMNIDLDIENLDQAYITPRKRAQSKSPEMPRNRKSIRNDRGYITPEQAASFIEQIYRSVPSSEIGIFKPTVKHGGQKRISPNYFLSWNFDIDSNDSSVGSFEIMRLKSSTPVSEADKSKVMILIDWVTTYNRLVDRISQIHNTTSDDLLVEQLDNLRDDIMNQIYGSSPDVDSVDVDAFIDNPNRNDVKRTMADMLNKLEGKGFWVQGTPGISDAFSSRLRGRGLRGSGRAANLRDIEGSGSASALKYHKIGSKYIRIPDLRQNRLKLVYPNRSQLGKIIDISPKLSNLINELVFDQNINQQLYDELSISDQKLFHEILRLTHMQYQFRDGLSDPLEKLRGEYDKLRSQIMIGNDNPDLIRELKALAVDLYSQKLISEEEFKSIIIV